MRLAFSLRLTDAPDIEGLSRTDWNPWVCRVAFFLVTELALLNSAPRAATVRPLTGSGRLRVATLGEKAFTRLLGPVVEILTRRAERNYGVLALSSGAGAVAGGMVSPTRSAFGGENERGSSSSGGGGGGGGGGRDVGPRESSGKSPMRGGNGHGSAGRPPSAPRERESRERLREHRDRDEERERRERKKSEDVVMG